MKIDKDELYKAFKELLDGMERLAADNPEPDFRKLEKGVYRIFWKNGNRSVASVGRNDSGEVWFAPADWMTVPFFGWTNVERVELIEGDPK